jgi:hypothetical protein
MKTFTSDNDDTFHFFEVQGVQKKLLINSKFVLTDELQIEPQAKMYNKFKDKEVHVHKQIKRGYITRNFFFG